MEDNVRKLSNEGVCSMKEEECHDFYGFYVIKSFFWLNVGLIWMFLIFLSFKKLILCLIFQKFGLSDFRNIFNFIYKILKNSFDLY